MNWIERIFGIEINKKPIINWINSSFKKYSFISDALFALFFGTLSLGFEEFKLNFLVTDPNQTDFREIPLIISVFYIKNPLFLIISCIVSTIGLYSIGDYWELKDNISLVVHIIPIVSTWLFYNKLNKVSSNAYVKGISMVVFVILIYYALILIPSAIYIENFLGIYTGDFMKSYISIMSLVQLEIVGTALIVGLYLVQFDILKKLKEYQKNLKSTIEIRTKELAYTNIRLISTNDELSENSKNINLMNENLDSLVKERSKKIEDQLDLLKRYAHINSHEVRAPLARILGLMEIIRLDKMIFEKNDIIGLLYKSSNELDEVVKSMNRLLEKEIIPKESTRS